MGTKKQWGPKKCWETTSKESTLASKNSEAGDSLDSGRDKQKVKQLTCRDFSNHLDTTYQINSSFMVLQWGCSKL